MENENKILDLIKKEEATLAGLGLEARNHKARISGFKESLATLNGSSDDNFKRKIEEKIRKETAAEEEISNRAFEVTSRLAAFQEAHKLLSKNGSDGKPKDLRPDSELARVRDLIRKAAKPLSLTEILTGIGKPNDKKKLISLRGTLRSYANEGRVFFRGETSDVFGLLEFRL